MFRSTDGGKSWEQVLFRGQDAGASDLSMDPHNPRVLYASFWEDAPHALEPDQRRPGQRPVQVDRWRRHLDRDLAATRGCPRRSCSARSACVPQAHGRSASSPIVEAEDGAVFRSDDGGETWTALSEDARTCGSAPGTTTTSSPTRQDAETVWVLNVETWKSHDGGKTFCGFAIPHGDNHDLWIDPRDPRRMIEGNDGGATVTVQRRRELVVDLQPADRRVLSRHHRHPISLSHSTPRSRTTPRSPCRVARRWSAITQSEAIEIGGGESGYIAVRPDNPNIIYAGSYLGYMTRYDHATGQARSIEVWPEDVLGGGASDASYRFQWTFPTLLSPHDPNTL